MLQFDAWKKAVVAVTILFGVLYATPNILGSGGGASFLPGSPINLGLDLQGGSHLLLRVDIEEVERERLTNLADGLRVEMRKNKVAFRNLDVENAALTFGLRNVEDNDKVNSYISELSRDYDVVIEDLEWRLTLSEQGRIDVPVLNGREVKVRSISPLAQAQANQDISSVARYLQMVGGTFGPEILNLLIKSEDVAVYLAKKFGVPDSLVRDGVEREQIAMAAQQYQQAQQRGEVPDVDEFRS